MTINSNLNYSVFEDEEWAIKASKLIAKEVESCCLRKGKCDFMLTGGETASQLYLELFPLIKGFSERIYFYFGDERCVDTNSPDSNYNMVINLLPNYFNKDRFYRIIGDSKDAKEECVRYSELLPERIDILLLSIGVDSHIASLFPGFDLISNPNKVITSQSPYHKYQRITITKEVIDNSIQVFCLARGRAKGQALANSLKENSTITEYPARLVKSKQWILDLSAANYLLL
jgi:6-phosphogluconolactonase